MANNDVKIKLSLDGDKQVIDGLNGVGDGAGKADSKLGSFISGGLKGTGVALAVLGTAAVAAGGALSGAVISAYADAEQSVGGIETLFKDAADTMKDYAKDAYKDAGLSANEYMEQATSTSAALIQAVGGDTAKAAELANVALVSMSDNANKMGTDLSSIQDAFGGFAKQNYTMLDNLKLGYGGTQAEMQRLLDDAEKLPGALGQEFDLSNYGDIVTAIQLIQEEMGIAGTTALEANETISGSVGMLKGSFDNLLVAMGSANNESLAFLDVQEQAANVVSSLESVIGNVAPVIESIGGSLSTLGPQLGGMLESLIGTVVSLIPGLLDAGVAMIGGLIQGITSSLPALIEAIVPAVVGLVEMLATQLPLLVDAGMQAVIALAQGLAEALPTLIPAVVEMVVGIVQALIDNLPMLLEAAQQLMTGLSKGLLNALPVLVEALPEIISSLVEFLIGAIPTIVNAGFEMFMALIQALPDIIVGIVAAIPEIITGIIEALMNAIPAIVEGGLTLFLSLIEALPEIIEGLVTALPQIVTALVEGFGAMGPRLSQAGQKLLTSLVEKIGPIAAEIASKIPQVIDRIIGAVMNGLGGMAQAGGDLVRGLWNGISDAAGWLLGKISGFVDQVMGGIKDFFGIKSPSRRMRFEVGVQLPAGIGDGIEQNEQSALKPIKDLNKKIMEEATSLPSLNIGHTVDLLSAGKVNASMASPQYARVATAASAPTVVVDTTDLSKVFENWLEAQQQQPQVIMDTKINMYDRDPRIVGKQLGRKAKGVLVG